MVMAVTELEAAVAALPSKRDALREAYDRLAACSPWPLPFAWEDLDAHLSSLQASISLQFRQFQVLEAARTAPADAAFGGTRYDRTTGILEEEEEAEEEEMQEGDYDEADDKIGNDGKDETEVVDEMGEVEEVPHDKFGNEIKDEEVAMVEGQASEADEQDAEEEMQVADGEGPNTKDAFKASPDEEQDTNMDVTVANKASAMLGKEEEETNLEQEQDTNMDQMVAKKASAMLHNEEEASMEEQDTNMDKRVAKKAPAAHVREEEASMEEEQDTNMDEMAAKKASAVHGREEEASMEEQQDTNMDEMVVKKVSAVQGKVEEAFSEKQEEEAEEHGLMKRRKMPKMLPRGRQQWLRRCLGIRVIRLFQVYSMIAPQHALARMHRALALQVVELFLHSKILKTKKVWANFVRIIQMVHVAVTKPSADTIEQAKRVARDWNKMIGNPGSCTVLVNLASWGLLYFLISYKIVSEFDKKEIFHLFGAIPRKKQKNSAFLIKAIGLTDRIPELMDYLIENGQQRYILYLARVLNLVDKYSPLSLLKGYVERAEQTAREICEKNMTRQSMYAVIIKEIDNLERALDLAKQEITDSSLYTSISTEIFALLDEFVEKERSLANASTASTSNSQQQQIENNKKRKKVQQQKHHKGQENQLAKKRNRPRQEQQQKQEDKPNEQQQQKQEDKPNEKQKQQNKQKCTKRKQASSAVRGIAPGGHFGYPPYTTMHHHGYPAQTVWPGNHSAAAAPFVPQLGAPGYIGPVNPFYYRPEFCPW
ncbi:hypothetical protein BS78_01G162900 [Paspalum vaginatum]|nr:hypothetical protein BS78_01G162900 [Paspalum vaginatum]